MNNLKRRYQVNGSEYSLDGIEEYMSTKVCQVCNGDRLKPESLAVTVGDKSIAQITALSIRDALAFLKIFLLALGKK